MPTVNGHTPIDYRALIQDRKAKQTRPIVRHIICLVPELFADLEDLRVAQRSEQISMLGTDDDDSPTGDIRLGVRPVSSLIDDLEARISEVSVVGVFKAPTATRQQELNKTYDEDSGIAQAIELILEAFVHFERNREPIPVAELGRADLADLLPEMAQGEMLALSTRIVDASGGAPDLPLSVRQSLLNRPSAATSKRR